MGSVRTLQCQTSNDVSMYIGTTGNCILEGSMARKFTVIVWGHSKRLDAIAVHPDDLAFVSAGYDKVVAKWRKQKVVWKVTTQTECVSASYHPSASWVAVGTLDGHVVVLNAETGGHVATTKVCGAPINDLEFNREGDLLAVASQNGTVYTFRSAGKGNGNNGKEGSNGGQGLASLRRHHRIACGVSLMHLDWSEDSAYLQAVTVNFDLVHIDHRSGRVERRPAAAACRDETWADQTCTLGYAVAGTWNNINYKNDPSTTTAVHVGNHRTRLAAGDVHGYLRLFQYPCTSPRAEYLEQKPISSAITSVRFLFEDMYLLSVGGAEATLIRWKIT